MGSSMKGPEEWWKKPRKIIVEAPHQGWEQVEVWYPAEYGEGQLTEVVQEALRYMGGWGFEHIPDTERSYHGWRRMTVNISGPLCIVKNCGYDLDEDELDGGLCPDCSEVPLSARECRADVDDYYKRMEEEENA